MTFEFITETGELTELQVLINIYNLLLMYFIYDVCKFGFKYITAFIKKGVIR